MSRFPTLRQDLSLAWISGITLFFEILMIRWLSAELRIFAYFHNLVLLFCFLGIGLGYLRARKPAMLLHAFLILGFLALWLRLDPLLGSCSLRRISSLLSVGTRFSIWDVSAVAGTGAALPAFALGVTMLMACMTLLTLFFVPFGQLLGRRFDASRRPLRAYSMNLIGSLAGIWLFAGVSWLSAPPAVWVAIGGLACVPLLWRSRRELLLVGGVVALSIITLVDRRSPSHWTQWSPYQKLTVQPIDLLSDQTVVRYGYKVLVNSANYMLMSNYAPEFQRRYPEFYPPAEIPYDHYNVPYRFTPHLHQVLVVGAGAGNDVAGALRNGAHAVTAVEIDPVISALGTLLHPEAPYRDPRVRIVNDDARSFFKRSRERYDLIICGLLDSHTLSSSYSNVRLDNYVYTLESFQDMKRLLTPDGVALVFFQVEDDFIGARLQQIATQVFGAAPVGFEVHSGLLGWGGFGYVTGNQAVIQRRLAQDARLSALVERSREVFARWSAATVELTRDDWPYLYLQRRTIPGLYLVVLGVLLGMSVLGVRWAGTGKAGIDWPFCFLGGGFLLLEVQNISKSALLFGATWMVNTVVISAMLAVSLIANGIAARWRIGLRPAYLLLLVALGMNGVMPIELLSQLPLLWKTLGAMLLMSLPVLCAGIIFSVAFATTRDRAGAFASNLLGAMAGGMAECIAFVTGIRSLLVVAGLLYLGAMATQRPGRKSR